MPIHLPPISRRRFLASTLAAASAAMVPQNLWSATKTVDPERWALLSDTHIWEKRDGVHRGAKPLESFNRALAGVLALDPQPAGMIISGDCAYMEGQPGDYAVLADLLAPVRAAGIPIHLVLGNHDHREHFWTGVPQAKPAVLPVVDKSISVVETAKAKWILLDSLEKTFSTPGLLGKEQLAWLDKSLSAAADKPVILIAHHYLEVAGGLKDAAAFWEVVAPRRQVKAYIFGHSHACSAKNRDDVQLINVPSTAWTFANAETTGWLDCRLTDAGANLTFQTLDPNHARNGERFEVKWRT